MIPVHVPELSKPEIDLACAAIREGLISGTHGAQIAGFEEAVAHACGARFGVATTSGSTALHLAVATLGIGPGDEVIVSALTNIASALAIVHCGATPVLADSEPETWNMDVERLAELVTPRTRAIMPVHIYGHPVDMDPVLSLAGKHGLAVIEDAAEAQGATYKGRPVGGLGTLNCLSFYANKVITTGEGGMVVTDDPDLAAKARSLKSLAFGREVRFLHEECGFNFRMTNVQAALGLGQMPRLAQIVERKRQIARWYLEGLREVRGLRLPVEREWATNVYWMFCVVVEPEFPFDRDALVQRLRERGIDTRNFFLPMNLQPAFRKRGLFEGVRLPVAEALGRSGFYLPSSSTLDRATIFEICDALDELSRAT